MKQKHWQVSVFDKTSKTIKDDTFYTTDTETYLVFELIDGGFTPNTATVTVYNVNGKATINVDVEVVDGIVRYEIPVEAIGHLGVWRTQVIFTKDGEDYTTNIIEFEVSGHLLDNNKPKLVAITNWNRFMKHAEGLIDDWEQLEKIRQTNEQQRELVESKRQTNELVRLANEADRVNAESIRAEFYEGFESELDKKVNKIQEDWITPTFLNGATGTIKYRKNELGNTEISGRLTVVTSGVALVLPVGYRISDSRIFIVSNNLPGAINSFKLYITNGGDLSISNASEGTYFISVTLI